MKADYAHKDTRTIVVDEVEMSTSLTAVEIASLQQENQELKKQLDGINEERTYLYNKLSAEKEQLNILVNSCLEEKETQQKEFIEYLEYQVKLQEKLNDIHLATGFEEILSKYKEIIGDDK